MKNKISLKTEYRKTFEYLKSLKNFLYFVLILFILFSLIGFFVPFPESFFNYLITYLHNLLAQTKGFNYFQWFRFIFLNNTFSSFTSCFGGIFLGIPAFFSSIVNGFLIGFVSKLSVGKEGFFSLWRLFPHGIFELPAIFISFATGLKLGTFIFYKKKKDILLYFLENNIRIFILVVIPLLFFAALIESAFIYFT